MRTRWSCTANVSSTQRHSAISLRFHFVYLFDSPARLRRRGQVIRKVIVGTFVTLDGVMQAPGAPDEDRAGGFEHGGWQMPYFDEAAGAAIFEGMASSDGFLMGRKTYEIMAPYWPGQPSDDPLAAQMNNLSKYVVSTTLDEPLEWSNSTLLKAPSRRRFQS